MAYRRTITTIMEHDPSSNADNASSALEINSSSSEHFDRSALDSRASNAVHLRAAGSTQIPRLSSDTTLLPVGSNEGIASGSSSGAAHVQSHIGEPLENLARSVSLSGRSRRDSSRGARLSVSSRRRSIFEEMFSDGIPEEKSIRHFADGEALSKPPVGQGRPPELPSTSAEVFFVLVCSAGQLLFSWSLGDTNVNQMQFQRALAIQNTELPWLQGAFNIAQGLSVIVSGSLTDLAPPKRLMVGAFIWLTIWNTVGAFAISPSRAVLFFLVRAMQGLATGVLASGSMSMTGRIYQPGIRKTRVFSSMAAMAPLGFWLGALQGGAFSAHLPWIFATNAMVCGLLAIAAFLTIPALKPECDVIGMEAPSLKQFDYPGAACAVSGCVCLVFGLTQGSATGWSPYTYAVVIVGLVVLVAFFLIERRVVRPLIPARLWKTKGFMPLMIAYFLGFGAFVGPWQFYAVQFWLRIQRARPLTVALYLLPNAIFGVLAAFIVSRVLHRVPGHWIFATSMIAFALGPVFFLPQKQNTAYWALSMPGVALVTFGPDLSFAAASIFITSNVARSYQGSAGSLLMTVQNLSAAVMTAIADDIGSRVDLNETGEVGLTGLKASWWFGLAASLTGALITIIFVRIPKEEEKEHVI